MFRDAISLLAPTTHGVEVYVQNVRLPDTHFDSIDQMDEEELIDAMMPDAPPTPTVDIWDRKYVAWNFLSLRRLGSVEYRQGLHSDNKSPKDAFLASDFSFLSSFLLMMKELLLEAALRVRCHQAVV